jgi:organic hydroperoxide reductase OsmC/OhrA
MSHEYHATVLWTRGDARFVDRRYSRGHVWRFDSGVEVPASSSPLSVPLPYSVEAAVDPEEAFVAAIASCHMLFFLDFASRAGFLVDRYADTPLGVMTENAAGKLFVSKVTLNPSVVFGAGKVPSEQDVAELHHKSHEDCFIANSVKGEVVLGASRFSVDARAGS